MKPTENEGTEAKFIPEVGELVETLNSGRWLKPVVYGTAEYGGCLAKAEGYWYDEYQEERIRPIKSERDLFIGLAAEAICGASIEQLDAKGSTRRIAGILFDAGFKAPEVV